MVELNSNEPKPGSDGGKVRFTRSFVGWLIILLAAIVLLVVFRTDRQPETITYGQFLTRLEQGHFHTIVIRNDPDTFVIIGSPRTSAPESPGRVLARVPTTALDGYGWQQLNRVAGENGAIVDYQPNTSFWLNILLPMLPYLIIILFIWFFFLRTISKGRQCSKCGGPLEPSGK